MGTELPGARARARARSRRIPEPLGPPRGGRVPCTEPPRGRHSLLCSQLVKVREQFWTSKGKL